MVQDRGNGGGGGGGGGGQVLWCFFEPKTALLRVLCAGMLSS